MTQWLFRKSCRCAAPLQDVLESNARSNHENETAIATRAQEPDFGERYTVRQRLGSGGMATVFRVEDRQLNQQFALKAFHKQPWSSDSLHARVEQESRALTELNHANIANVYGHGQTVDGIPYLILDWIEGKTLAEVIAEEGGLSEERALNLFVQLTEALQHAHFKGVIHRDLKPSNIVIRRTEADDEQVKVIDFGVAKLMQSDNSDPYTRTGEVFGTPLYMSPEQSQGEAIDGRSDIYSLGCVMYEVLTGKPPFADDNAVKVILKHLKEDAKPFRLVPGVRNFNPDLEKLVMQCLEKSPQKRYQLMDELLLDLQALQQKTMRRFAYVNPTPHWLRRYLASVVDGVILTVPTVIVLLIVTVCMTGKPIDAGDVHYFLSLFVFALCPLQLFLGPAALAYLVSLIASSSFEPANALLLFLCGTATTLGLSCYYAGFESSRMMATPGKLLFGLAVVNPKGERISLLRGLWRAYSKVLHIGTSGVDHSIRLSLIDKRKIQDTLKCLFNPLVEPLIDEMTGTYVIDRKAVSTTHKLELHHPINFATMPMERIHFIRQSLIGQCIGGLILFLIVIELTLHVSASNGHSAAGIVSLTFVASILTGPQFYFLWQINHLRKKMLQKRRLERDKLRSGNVMHLLNEKEDA
ncbi:MAG: protein kinase [Candidatus Obscuribacterales bacterium]|nr:protein kinase [Candidatus Obscuribacterales bacterium]